MKASVVAAVIVAIAYSSAGCATFGLGLPAGSASEPRSDIIARAQVWSRTNVSTMNLRVGPQGPGSFKPDATIRCDYVDVRFSGNSPKFACRTPAGEQLKVKHGIENGGVYGCTGNLRRSFTGSLEHPAISEAGRRFLANLLGQLSDRQLRDLFEAAGVPHRLRSPGEPSSGFATVAEWVETFKAKRTEIATRRCV